MTVKHRHYFECEKGARWSEVEWDYTEEDLKHYKDIRGKEMPIDLISKDGDICSFSGCMKNHKIKLIKSDNNENEGKFTWFRRPEREAEMKRLSIARKKWLAAKIKRMKAEEIETRLKAEYENLKVLLADKAEGRTI